MHVDDLIDSLVAQDFRVAKDDVTGRGISKEMEMNASLETT